MNFGLAELLELLVELLRVVDESLPDLSGFEIICRLPRLFVLDQGCCLAANTPMYAVWDI